MTMVPQESTRPFGCEELHAVFFQHHADRGGASSTVVLMIPEAADTLTAALKQAREMGARLVIVCDTERQARDAKEVALDSLPDHREVSLSRAEAGVGPSF